MPNISVLMRMIALVFASVMFTLAEASAGPVADELQPPSAPPETAAGDAGAISLTVGGTTRSYLLHVPPLGGALPLVVSIHGRGSNAERHQNVSGLSRLADSEGFIVAYPDALDATWRFAEPGPDEDFILAMIADIAARTATDPSRIYVDGISNGAQMSWRLACDHPDLFAAVGLVSGSYLAVCNAGRVPVILFHGTSDKVLPYVGRAPFMPVRDFAIGSAAQPGCDLAPEGEIVAKAGAVTGERWVCSGGAPVVLYTIEGGRHAWPGQRRGSGVADAADFEASRTMWEFFREFSR